jgi:asparagine synthase (glutamine-hydrolysing)
MCGIAGAFNIKGFSSKNIVVMTDVIKHRGPDDEGFYFENFDSALIEICGGDDTPIEAYQGDFLFSPKFHNKLSNEIVSIGLGHRRLSILDLSIAGHQPMTFDSNNWIVYNGEIYNFSEIRAELIEIGYHFVSNTDTEVILAAFSEWGISCQDRFSGMFSFALFDREKRSLFLSRDRYGIKPLYYWVSPDSTLYFASEIKQFTVLPGWRAVLNHLRASDFLFYHGLTDHTEETLFKGVYQVLPGHYIKLDLNKIILLPNSKLDLTNWYKFISKPINAKDQINNFKKKLEESVERHLRSDVRVGSALSGGLDSSSVVCLVNKILKKSGDSELQSTFSSVNSDSRYSEKEWMDEVIRHIGCEANFISPKPEDLLIDLEKVLWHMDEPYQSQSAYLGYCIFKKASEQKTKVLLNGQGADEFLGGYGSFLSIYYGKMSVYDHFKLLKKRNKNQLNAKVFLEIFNSKVKYFYMVTPSWIKGMLVRRSFKHRNLKQLIDSDILKGAGNYPFKKNETRFKNHSDISKFQIYKDALPRYLRWEDRNSMAHSVEARVPFLDHNLVEFSQSLELNQLVSDCSAKAILVESMVDILPEIVRNRKDKQGFLTPEERWVKQDFTKEFRILLEESILNSKGIIKKDALRYFDRVVRGELPFDFTYWRIIAFGKWMKIFDVYLK